MKTAEATPVIIDETKSTKPDFGAGRYSALMEGVHTEAQVVFGLPSDKAEKLARQCASDFGAAMARQTVTARVGKATSKDGKVTLSEAAKAKGVTQTNALRAMQSLGYAADCGKYGFAWKATQFILIGGEGSLLEYLESL